MSVKVSPGGLSGLIVKISDELKNEKSLDEILSKYPVSKTAFPYLLTLQEEYSKMFLEFVKEEYAPLEEENNTLKERIKQLESKKDIIKGKDIEKLQTELERLKNENEALKNEIVELKQDNDELSVQLKDLSYYQAFFDSNSLCSMFYRNFLRKLSNGI